MKPEFTEYQKLIVQNAKLLSEELMNLGFKLISGGTDNHLMVIHLKDMTGKEAEECLDKVGLTVNKNTIPFEKLSPFVTSGIRLGTPSITARGMKPSEMKWLAKMIYRALIEKEDSKGLREEVAAMCARFPIYKDL